MNMVRRRIATLCSWKASLLADQRGAVALEMPAVLVFLLFSMLLPLADVAIAGFQYISAVQALRAFGQSILYSQPPDLSNTSSWAATAIAKADSRYPISNFQLICGDDVVVKVCSAANTANPKYYSYATTISLSPMTPGMSNVLCNGGNCTITLSYSERFQ
jgi:Flp pilus assembly protein TadG